MNRGGQLLRPPDRRMPHVCGDEPDAADPLAEALSVCPTYVGMNRLHPGRQPGTGSMPHVCGDEPSLALVRSPCGVYAPRMWG